MSRRISMVAALVPMMMAAYAWGGVADTSHNFSGKIWSNGEICKPCHTPHNAKPNDVSGRMWNHELTTATYVMNSHNMETFTGTAANDLDRVSRMCLSCHDGTLALDAYGTTPGSSEFITGSKNLGLGGAAGTTDLSNDHPVGNHAAYAYSDEETVGSRYKPMTVTETTLPDGGKSYTATVAVLGSASSKLSLAWTGGFRSVINKDTKAVSSRADFVIGCRTCHNPHGTSFPKMLNASNTASNLCLSCHNK